MCYGQEHSRTHRHACHGETYDPGLFSAWGEGNPVHLIGHSFGGQTARVLQHLIATGEGDRVRAPSRSDVTTFLCFR